MTIMESALPVLRVADVERSVEWYTQVLGFSARCFPSERPHQLAVLRRGAVELLLQAVAAGEAAGPLSPKGWSVLLRVPPDGLLPLHDQVQRLTRVLAGPWQRPYGSAEFEVADLDGHRLCFSETLPGSDGGWSRG